MAVQPQGCGPAPYRRRRPADTPLYRVVQNHLETFLSRGRDEWWEERVTPHAERELRRFLECGILAHGFARARCDACGHVFLIAFSCKGRAVCPSCNTRRMAETAAHLADHVLPRVPVRQWVLSVPKRLRYHLQHDREAISSVLRIFLDAVEQHLRGYSRGASPKARTGAVAFIHRFGSSLNEHTRFHVVVIDGVFEPGREQGVRFIAAEALDATPCGWCKPRSAGVSCKHSYAVDGSTRRPVGTWKRGPKAAGSRWMPACTSRPMTDRAWNASCATAPAHPSLPTGWRNSTTSG
jgi:uncharacterized Zn finger protein (UPF0148 family)